jgi:hypothetical protein
MSIDVDKFPYNGRELVGQWHLVFKNEAMNGTFAFGTVVENGRTVNPVVPRIARHFVAALGPDVVAAYSQDAGEDGMAVILGEMPDEDALEIYELSISTWFHALAEDHPLRGVIANPDHTREDVQAVVPAAVFAAFERAREIQDRIAPPAIIASQTAEEAEAARAAEEAAEAERFAKEEAAKRETDPAPPEENEEKLVEVDVHAGEEPKFEDPTPEDTAREMTAEAIEALDVDAAYALASELGVEIPASGTRRSKSRAIEALVKAGKLRIAGDTGE